MTASVFDSLIYGRLFGDREVVAQLEDRAQVDAMLRVEAALAGSLLDHLAAASAMDVDWQALGNPASRIETAVQMLDEFLALERRPPPQSTGKR